MWTIIGIVGVWILIDVLFVILRIRESEKK